jgi:hypothetical protein
MLSVIVCSPLRRENSVGTRREIRDADEHDDAKIIGHNWEVCRA